MNTRYPLLACVLVVAAAPAPAADARIDADLLEFLGAFDDDAEDFVDYLAQRPAGKPAPKPPAPPADAKEGKKP